MGQYPDMAKVLFRVPKGDGGEFCETLWAFPLGNDLFRIDNSPFYAYSVSLGDVVLAPFDDERGIASFERVVTKSGHRMIRVLFETAATDGSTSAQTLAEFVSLGCTFEGSNGRYICIDVPPQVELETVRKVAIHHALQFEHADPTYDDLFPDSVT